MFNEVKTRKELEERQALRLSASLPPIDIDAELKIIEWNAAESARCEELRVWKESNPDIIAQIENDILLDMRQRMDKAEDWMPSGFLSGAGYLYHVLCRESIQKAFDEVFPPSPYLLELRVASRLG